MPVSIPPEPWASARRRPRDPNAGGVVTDDVIRPLSISRHHVGTEEIIVLHHTDCGLLRFTNEEFASV